MSEQEPRKGLTKGRLTSLAFELGFIIALPIVAFGFGGKWLDQKIGTFPLLTLIGIFLAISLTTLWIYRKFRDYFKNQ